MICMKRLHDGRQTLTDKQEAYVIGLRELQSGVYVHWQKQKKAAVECRSVYEYKKYPTTKQIEKK